jgi:magnesium-transporting ATPase (P-type)
LINNTLLLQGPLEDAIAMVEKDSNHDVMPPAIKHLLESCMLYRVEVSQHIQFDEILKRPVLMWEGHDIDVALVKWFRKLNPAIDFESIRGQMVPNILKEFEEEVDGTDKSICLLLDICQFSSTFISISALRRHGILVRFENVFHYYCIGAAEFVLPLCDTGILPGGNLFDLNEEELLVGHCSHSFKRCSSMI